MISEKVTECPNILSSDVQWLWLVEQMFRFQNREYAIWAHPICELCIPLACPFILYAVGNLVPICKIYWL